MSGLCCFMLLLYELNFQAFAHALGDALQHLYAQVRVATFEPLVGLLCHAHFLGDCGLWYLAPCGSDLQGDGKFRVHFDAVESFAFVRLCLACWQRLAVKEPLA